MEEKMLENHRDVSAADGPGPPTTQPDRELPSKVRPSEPVEPQPGQRNPDPGPFIEPVQDPAPPPDRPADPVPRPYQANMH
jgi:hypothetical protein